MLDNNKLVCFFYKGKIVLSLVYFSKKTSVFTHCRSKSQYFIKSDLRQSIYFNQKKNFAKIISNNL